MRPFRQALHRRTAPRLRELGYEWNEKLGDRNLMYGFSKPLSEGVEAQIIFQRHQYQERAEGLRFTVGLRRRMVAGADSASMDWEAIGLDLRLPAVMWFVYRLRTTPSLDYWWNPLDESELAAALDDVMAKLEAYGIPWLEDASSHMPDWLPDEDLAQFRESLARAAAANLVSRGYRYIEVELRRRQAIWYARPLPGDLTALVIFGVGARAEGAGRAFQILLIRSRGNSLAYNPGDPTTLSLQFNNVLAYLDGWLDGIPPGPYPYAEWAYESASELEAQLAHACGLLEKIGLPWLEDLAATNDQRAQRPKYEKYAPLRAAVAN